MIIGACVATSTDRNLNQHNVRLSKKNQMRSCRVKYCGINREISRLN